MARNRYIKTRSNYVIKDLHQTTNVGTIFERDFMTVSGLNTYAPGNTPLYDLNGFKMVIKNGVTFKKKHHYGAWLTNDACEKKSVFWSLNCLEDTDYEIEDIKVKPNLHSILDFACFGSSVKLVESAIKNIVNTFPGELYFTDKKVNIEGITYYIVDNPFDIEMDTYLKEGYNYNSLRVFSESYDKYSFYNENGAVGKLSWDIYLEAKGNCRYENESLSTIDLGHPYGEDKSRILLFYKVYNGKKTLFHDGSYVNGRICPNNKIKNDFFKNLSIFEKALLNTRTNYTIELQTPKETDRGNVVYNKAYTWPKTLYGNWNINVKGDEYTTYIDSLLKIAEFYDTMFSDSIIRAMTHEAILNFDWTHTREGEDGVTEEQYNPNGDRMKAFIHVMGRQFDELKLYIDGISNINTVTYNESRNKPDVLLQEDLLNYGWEVKAPTSVINNKFKSDVLYPAFNEGYSAKEVNAEFYRRLLLNSHAILAAKGTKRAVEMIMALFGYHSLNYIEHSLHEIEVNGKLKTVKWKEISSEEQRKILKYSYDMTEYVYVAGEESGMWDGLNEGTENEQIVKAQQKINAVKEINTFKLGYDFNDGNEYQGLPIREVLVATTRYPIYKLNENGEMVIDYYLPDYKPYLIPWFDRNQDYDADIYFESKGGWGLKQTTVGRFGEYEDIIIDTNESLKVYDESVKYLRFVQTIDDLLNAFLDYPETNDVYYVYDIGGEKEYDWGYLTYEVKTTDKDGNEITKCVSEKEHTMSHYFVLKDKEQDHVLGAIRDENNRVLLDGSSYGEKEEGGEDKTNIVTTVGKVDEFGTPLKYYGWKNISEEELTLGISEDAKRVYYVESIIEENRGNAPHCGYGRYDDGDTYKEFFEDVFKGAKDNESFIETSDSEIPETNEYGFSLEKQIDNVKCWYFTDTFNTGQTLGEVSGNDIDGYTIRDIQTPSVGDGNFVRFTKMKNEDKATNENDNIFGSWQYKTLEPYNMEDSDNPDDEAAANSIINSKHFYIEFMPDMSSPGSMFEFLENIVMFYAKQVIPSTTLLKYYIPLRKMDVNCYKPTYLQSVIITE